MYLKKAFWSDSLNSDTETQSSSPVGDLVHSLDKQRLYREITLALRTGLKDARAEFSFLRVRGLRSILKFLRSVAESDSTINLFCHGQTIPDLQGQFFFFLFVFICYRFKMNVYTICSALYVSFFLIQFQVCVCQIQACECVMQWRIKVECIHDLFSSVCVN